MRGTTLSEVLIAVLVLGIGMLGIASLQATSLRNSQSSLERSQAVIATYAIIDAMRANRNDALAGAYHITNTCTMPPGGTTGGTDVHAWTIGRAECEERVGENGEVTGGMVIL